MVVSISVGSDWRGLNSSRVVSNVNAARKFRKFTDVTFVVGTDEDVCIIKAHRAVIGTANTELANLVSGYENSKWIRITDVSPRGFKNLIRYLYDADVKLTDLSSIRETHFVAEKFKVNKLKLAAQNCLTQAVNYESILEILQISIEFDLPELRDKCVDTISTQYRDILISEEFVSASFEVVDTFFCHPCHGPDCQIYALEAIGKWQKKHKVDQKRLENLLKCVDFTQVQTCFFDDFIEENVGILSDDDIKAFRRCILEKDVKKAPEWYRSEKFPFEKNYKINTKALEKNTLEMSLPDYMEKQKQIVRKTLDKELRQMGKTITEAADISLEFYEMAIKEITREIIEYFSRRIRDAVETSLDTIEDDMSGLAEDEGMENIKFTYEEKELGTPMEVDLVSDVATLPKTEDDSTEGSGTVLKSTETVEECEKANGKQGASSLLTESN